MSVVEVEDAAVVVVTVAVLDVVVVETTGDLDPVAADTRIICF